MTGPHPAVAATRVAVRRELARIKPGGIVLVACSGGADSLALAAAVAFEATRAGLTAAAVIVDHGLQEGSPAVADRGAEQCRRLGLDPVEVVSVQVASDGGGPEGQARDARYMAFEQVAERLGAAVVMLGHTRDDQAEQVLLGLARGSGARSLSGMPARRGLYVRPLLCVSRAMTTAACEAAGLTAWVDPHNSDPAYGRVRARALLPLLETELGPGAVAALARSADLLREDADALDDLAARARDEIGRGPAEATMLLTLPRAIRTRVLRLLAIEAGCPPGALVATHVEALDSLVTRWRGQGPVDLPGHVQGRRSGGRVVVTSTRQVE